MFKNTLLFNIKLTIYVILIFMYIIIFPNTLTKKLLCISTEVLANRLYTFWQQDHLSAANRKIALGYFT